MWIIVESEKVAQDLRRSLPPDVQPQVVAVGALKAGAVPRGSDLVLDVDLRDLALVRLLRTALNDRAPGSTRLVLCDRGARAQAMQAAALGASEIRDRPLSAVELTKLLRGPAPAALGDRARRARSAAEDGTRVLAGGFDALLRGAAFDGRAFQVAAASIVESTDEKRLALWLSVVKNHHAGTFGHVLLVAGLAAQFARGLGLGDEHCARAALAGLLHDIGKARIPLMLLEKPTALTDPERAIMRRHPEHGYAFLRDKPDIDAAVLHAVRHHHEYLDGTGYPDGLDAAAIPPLTRMLTIADIFAALVEDRGYRLGLHPTRAYGHLQTMSAEGKLDPDLVAAFRPVAETIAAGGDPAVGTDRGG